MNLALINNLFTTIPWYIQLGVLLFFLWQIDVKRRINSKRLLWGIGLVFGMYFVVAAGETFFQYITWAGGDLTKHFLPPFRPISYFLNYTGWRFWLPPGATVAFALIFLNIIYIARKNNSRLFYEGEEYLAALAILIVGWPSVVLYVPLILLLMVALSLVSAIQKEGKYTAFAFLWMPLALVMFIFGKWTIFKLGLDVYFISGS